MNQHQQTMRIYIMKTIKQIIEEETIRVEKLMHIIYDMDCNVDHNVDVVFAMEAYINRLKEVVAVEAYINRLKEVENKLKIN